MYRAQKEVQKSLETAKKWGKNNSLEEAEVSHGVNWNGRAYASYEETHQTYYNAICIVSALIPFSRSLAVSVLLIFVVEFSYISPIRLFYLARKPVPKPFFLSHFFAPILRQFIYSPLWVKPFWSSFLLRIFHLFSDLLFIAQAHRLFVRVSVSWQAAIVQNLFVHFGFYLVQSFFLSSFFVVFTLLLHSTTIPPPFHIRLDMKYIIRCWEKSCWLCSRH